MQRQKVIDHFARPLCAATAISAAVMPAGDGCHSASIDTTKPTLFYNKQNMGCGDSKQQKRINPSDDDITHQVYHQESYSAASNHDLDKGK